MTLLEEAEELKGYNFLNPHLFYVRTLLTLEVDTSMEAERHLNGTLAIYHTSLHLAKVLNGKRQLHSAQSLRYTVLMHIFRPQI